MPFKPEMPMPITAEVFGHALVGRGWLDPRQIDDNPVRWLYAGDRGEWAGRWRAANVFERVRKIAAKAWDKAGLNLLEQIIAHIEKASADCFYRAEAIVQARRTLKHIADAGYPHFEVFVSQLDEMLDEFSRVCRSEIVAALLAGAIKGSDAVAAISALQPPEVSRLLAGIEALEQENEVGFGT